MQVPVKLLQAARVSVQPALLVGIASSTAIFVATPFLLPAVAEEFGVSVGAAGWISTTQLAGFVVSSWVAGRFLRPVRSVFVMIGVLGVVANLASALAPSLPVLATARFVSGVSLGLAAWFAWQDAFGDAAKTGDVAVIGPLTGVIVAPVIAVLLDTVGLDGAFLALAVVAALPLAFAGQIATADRLRPHRTRHRATRAARVILVALGLVTLGGSSIFVYGAAIGTGVNGMSVVAVSLVYSCNAIASIPAAKWPGRRGPAGAWFFGTATCALTIGVVQSAVVFSLALISWGFVFFMGIPAAFALLATRSNFPEERAGDAQAVMALGRVFGPLVGGALIAAGQVRTLGGVAAGIIVAGAILLLYVDRERFAVAQRRTTPVTAEARP